MWELLQFTDLHITRSADNTLRGIDTRASLRAVYQRAMAWHGQPEALLLTGDIADDGSAEAYEHIREVFTSAPCPVLVIPGNHDHPETLREVLSQAPFVTHGTHAVGPRWCVHLLDSHVPGEVGGRLAPEALDGLRALASANDDQHHLLALHHPPMPMGSAWMDAIALDQADTFLEAVDAARGVRGVVWGHAHQRFDARRGKTRMLCAPSTCTQFAPGRDEFAMDNSRGAGYRHLVLREDGEIDTRVTWLPLNTGARATSK